MKIQELNEDNSILKKVLDSSYDGICISDKIGNILYCNIAFLNISGLKKENFLGQNLRVLVNKYEIPCACSLDAINKQKTITKVIDYFNGVSALVSSIPIFNEKKELTFVVSNIRDITELVRLREELQKKEIINNEYLEELNRFRSLYDNEHRIVVKSELMKKIFHIAYRIAKVNTPVLIQGESGVGKDVLARYIHESGKDSNKKPYVQINCTAIPENLLESELFGYEAGAFTGASRLGKRGLFEMANGGTIFLDEIGDISVSMQLKLLNVLQNNEIYRLGGTKSIKLNLRIIGATNSNLEEKISQNLFRKDLYYRLNVIPINIPPLRERREDIIPLVNSFIINYNNNNGINKSFSSETLKLLAEYAWPGNIRELKNIVERMLVLSEEQIIESSEVPNYIKETLQKKQRYDSLTLSEQYNLKKITAEIEAELITKALKSFGTVRKAAVHLGIDPATLVRKKKKYGIT